MAEMGWFQFSLFAMLIWGVWGFLGKIALNNLDWKVVYIFSGIGQLIVYLVFFVAARPSLAFSGNSTYYALIFGALGVLANVPFYQALSLGKASIVLPVSNLYPIITILLAVALLREQLTVTQGVGIIFGMLAIVLISTG
jgi:transporter family protein